MRPRRVFALALLLAGCVSKAEHEREVAERDRQIAERDSQIAELKAQAARGAEDCKTKVAIAERACKVAPAPAPQPDPASYPVAEKIAAFLKPGVKLPRKEKADTSADDDLWNITDKAKIKGAYDITLSRRQSDRAWQILISTTEDAGITTADFGTMDEKCARPRKPGQQGRWYKVTGGPLSGAYIYDQEQRQWEIKDARRLPDLACLR